MSRYSPFKKSQFQKHNDIWTGCKYIYLIQTAQKDFYIATHNRIDYKKTARLYYQKGFTDVNITFIGRDVTI